MFFCKDYNILYQNIQYAASSFHMYMWCVCVCLCIWRDVVCVCMELYVLHICDMCCLYVICMYVMYMCVVWVCGIFVCVMSVWCVCSGNMLAYVVPAYETRTGHHVSSSAMLHLIVLRQDASLYQTCHLARLVVQGALGFCLSLLHNARVTGMHPPPPTFYRVARIWTQAGLNTCRASPLPQSLSPASVVIFLIQKGYPRETSKAVELDSTYT